MIDADRVWASVVSLNHYEPEFPGNWEFQALDVTCEGVDRLGAMALARFAADARLQASPDGDLTQVSLMMGSRRCHCQSYSLPHPRVLRLLCDTGNLLRGNGTKSDSFKDVVEFLSLVVVLCNPSAVVLLQEDATLDDRLWRQNPNARVLFP